MSFFFYYNLLCRRYLPRHKRAWGRIGPCKTGLNLLSEHAVCNFFKLSQPRSAKGPQQQLLRHETRWSEPVSSSFERPWCQCCCSPPWVWGYKMFSFLKQMELLWHCANFTLSPKGRFSGTEQQIPRNTSTSFSHLSTLSSAEKRLWMKS